MPDSTTADKRAAGPKDNLRSFFQGDVAKSFSGIGHVQKNLVVVECQFCPTVNGVIYAAGGELESPFILNPQEVHIGFQYLEVVVGSLVGRESLTHLHTEGGFSGCGWHNR